MGPKEIRFELIILVMNDFVLINQVRYMSLNCMYIFHSPFVSTILNKEKNNIFNETQSGLTNSAVLYLKPSHLHTIHSQLPTSLKFVEVGS
mgnify:CR=1 FL=1